MNWNTRAPIACVRLPKLVLIVQTRAVGRTMSSQVHSRVARGSLCSRPSRGVFTARALDSRALRGLKAFKGVQCSFYVSTHLQSTLLRTLITKGFLSAGWLASANTPPFHLSSTPGHEDQRIGSLGLKPRFLGNLMGLQPNIPTSEIQIPYTRTVACLEDIISGYHGRGPKMAHFDLNVPLHLYCAPLEQI